MVCPTGRTINCPTHRRNLASAGVHRRVCVVAVVGIGAGESNTSCWAGEEHARCTTGRDPHKPGPARSRSRSRTRSRPQLPASPWKRQRSFWSFFAKATSIATTRSSCSLPDRCVASSTRLWRRHTSRIAAQSTAQPRRWRVPGSPWRRRTHRASHGRTASLPRVGRGIGIGIGCGQACRGAAFDHRALATLTPPPGSAGA